MDCRLKRSDGYRGAVGAKWFFRLLLPTIVLLRISGQRDVYDRALYKCIYIFIYIYIIYIHVYLTVASFHDHRPD